jgi:hypothetical protein
MDPALPQEVEAKQKGLVVFTLIASFQVLILLYMIIFEISLDGLNNLYKPVPVMILIFQSFELDSC